MTSTGMASLPYHEPSIATILNLSTFLLSLNLINSLLDHLLYAGLLGQLLIGILWGTPGAHWLSDPLQSVIQQLGYLGLIVLVYEGGLGVSFSALRANLLLSVAVAGTGIAVPMALSFVLVRMLGVTMLQAFAAGAALSATSLGTTFTILSATGLMRKRLGVVAGCAAMMDDVVGLVMVQIITNLGSADGDGLDAVAVVRPIAVSVGLAGGLVLVCWAVVGPVLRKMKKSKNIKIPRLVSSFGFAFLAHSGVLVGIVAGATYAGASSLFAAYLAGAVVSWFDEVFGINGTGETGAEERDESEQKAPSSSPPDTNASPPTPSSSPRQLPTGELVYERYYKEPVNRILKPLFFASIGFAIPVSEMFRGTVVWRGFVYALLMTFAKLVTGLWLCRVSLPVLPLRSTLATLTSSIRRRLNFCFTTQKKKEEKTVSPTTEMQDQNPPSTQPQSPGEAAPKPVSLYPASILGLSMVARGEIGYLIASLAETRGVFAPNGSGGSGSSEIYLVVVWAITLCTLVGPLCVGMLVRRVKTLQEGRKERGEGARDVLGVWGV